MNKPIKIKIKTHKVSEGLAGVVRIEPDAEIILRQLSRQSGLSVRFLASEIIRKAADLVEFIDADASDDA